jgi:hypothetical protein
MPGMGMASSAASGGMGVWQGVLQMLPFGLGAPLAAMLGYMDQSTNLATQHERAVSRLAPFGANARAASYSPLEAPEILTQFWKARGGYQYSFKDADPFAAPEVHSAAAGRWASRRALELNRAGIDAGSQGAFLRPFTAGGGGFVARSGEGNWSNMQTLTRAVQLGTELGLERARIPELLTGISSEAQKYAGSGTRLDVTGAMRTMLGLGAAGFRGTQSLSAMSNVRDRFASGRIPGLFTEDAFEAEMIGMLQPTSLRDYYMKRAAISESPDLQTLMMQGMAGRQGPLGWAWTSQFGGMDPRMAEAYNRAEIPSELDHADPKIIRRMLRGIPRNLQGKAAADIAKQIKFGYQVAPTTYAMRSGGHIMGQKFSKVGLPVMGETLRLINSTLGNIPGVGPHVQEIIGPVLQEMVKGGMIPDGEGYLDRGAGIYNGAVDRTMETMDIFANPGRSMREVIGGARELLRQNVVKPVVRMMPGGGGPASPRAPGAAGGTSEVILINKTGRPMDYQVRRAP